MAQRRSAPVLLALALATPVLALPRAAPAQGTAELDLARQRFREALSLEAAGDWAGALGKLEEVARVKLTPQVRFHIARCKDHLGRLTEALGEYRLAEFEARQASAPELADITAARESLEERMPRVTITLAEGAEGARVELDGVAFGTPNLGQERPIDPGPHRVKATLPDGRTWEQKFSAAEGEQVGIELVVPRGLAPPAPASGEAPPAPPAAAPPASDPVAEPAAPAPPAPGDGGSLVPWVVGGVGVLALGAGGYFWLEHRAAESDLDGRCRGSVCPESSRTLQEDSASAATLANLCLGAGVVAVGVAVGLLVLDGAEAPPADRAALSPEVEVTTRYGGVSLRGRF